tara:strand:+ start:750 stop:929 length:180 start_codon:yes stop_codon:yes gene_type:complete
MKLHHSVVERLLKIYDTYGGYRENTRLKKELVELDLSVYQQQTGDKNQILVETSDLQSG